MLWLRKGLVGLLSSILLVSLVGLAISTSLSSAFSSSTHLTNWVDQSNFYPGLLTQASSDTTKAIGSSAVSSQLSPVIQQTLSSVFSKSDFNSDVSAIINNNYSWLKGQTATPSFSINLSSQKTAFANALGNYVSTRYNALPECSASQIENLSSVTNPLTMTCRVPSISAASLESQIVSEIQNNTLVIKNPDITPSSITRENGAPYYTKFNAPKVYKHLTEVPDVLALIAVICIVGIFFISLRKSRAIRKISIAFTLAGILLLIGIIGSDKLETMINNRLAKHSSLTSFESSLSTLVHKIISYLNSIDLWFAIAYLVIGVGLLMLVFWKHRPNKSKPTQQPTRKSHNQATNDTESLPRPRGRQSSAEPIRPINNVSGMDIVAPPSVTPKVQPTAPTLRRPSPPQQKGSPSHKRRLIQ